MLWILPHLSSSLGTPEWRRKKVRKAGMVKRQQAKKHTKAQQRRKFASRRMISNPQAATQKRLEDLLSTLPFLAFSERFEDLQFDIQKVKEELKQKLQNHCCS